MPNWIEGTMKLRGKRENIRRFFNEGLDASSFGVKEKQVIDHSDEELLEFEFHDEPWINDSRRAFITSDGCYMEEDEGVACVDVKQAWSFNGGPSYGDMEKWKAISDEYDLDIKLFGIESGFQIVEEIIIVRGKKPIDNVIQYEDWDWECPFPRMGG